ncbi:hypothetical protein Ancab_007308 [Ancistrocladus abbreviatus]
MVDFTTWEEDVIVEDADYLSDQMSTRLWNTKGLLQKTMDDAEDLMPDDDYKIFLLRLEEFSQRRADEEEDIDPHYKLFLDHSKVYGHAYVLDIVMADGLPAHIKYEYVDEQDGQPRRKRPKCPRGALFRERKSSGMDGDSTFNFKRPYSQKQTTKLRHRLRGSSNSMSRGKDGSLKVKPSLNLSHSSDENFKGQIGPTMADVSYSMFLDRLKVEGEFLIYVHENGKELKYEQDDEESPVTSVKEASETAPFSSDMMPLDDQCCSLNPKSSFRERVMNILRKPYNRKEYEDLWNRANDRKLITYYRETREKFIPYTVPGHFGKSYLDHHLDLQEKIEVVQSDHYKVLNLLRGFFFWLEHVSDDGVFVPWKDELCQKVMPGSQVWAFQ